MIRPKGYCTRMLSERLPVRRRGAELFLVQALLLLFLERIQPGNEMLWESPWEPPGPRPWWTNKQYKKRRRKMHMHDNMFVRPDSH